MPAPYATRRGGCLLLAPATVTNTAGVMGRAVLNALHYIGRQISHYPNLGAAPTNTSITEAPWRMNASNYHHQPKVSVIALLQHRLYMAPAPQWLLCALMVVNGGELPRLP